MRFWERVSLRVRFATKVGVGDNDGCDADEGSKVGDGIV
jgi:hypothetical protein